MRQPPPCLSRTQAREQFLLLLVLGSVFLAALLAERPALAGGRLLVGGPLHVEGQIFRWDTELGEVHYRTDRGSLGILNNATANTRVGAMFQVWEDVTTATIGFNRTGPLLSTGTFSDGDVNTVAEFDAVAATCGTLPPGIQNPIVYDVDGSLFAAIGTDPDVIGFAGVCQIAVVVGENSITGAFAALNGDFRDGDADGGRELTDNEFDAVFIHEFGHFFGLDHSQININCLTDPLTCVDFSDDAFGLPTMFPFLLSGLEESPGVHPASTLSQDDKAWVSQTYPAFDFGSNFASIRGKIFFSDGITHAQGVNVIAREVDDPATPMIDESRRNASSVVSGAIFTGNAGQSVTGTNTGGSPFGSRNSNIIGLYSVPVPVGKMYTVEVESINPAFTAGSSVGPLDPPFPNPGLNEFFDFGESATDDPTAASPIIPGFEADIILNGTPPRFDSFESSYLRWLEPLPAWIRRGLPTDVMAG